MYLSIWHLLLEQITAFLGLLILVYYAYKDPLLQTLRGTRWLAAAFATQLVLFVAPTLVRSFPPRAELVLHILEHVFLIGGLFLVVRDLASLKILRNALEDPESGLPNRSQWERHKREFLVKSDRKAWEVEVALTSIETVRTLSEAASEKAFFDWIGSVINRRKDSPGFVARTGIRTLSFMIQHEDSEEAAYKVERYIQMLQSDIRSGGFSMTFTVFAREPHSTVF